MTSRNLHLRSSIGPGLALAALALLAASPARAAELWLRAGTTTKTMPGGATIPMWGYAACTAGFATCGAVTSPGPEISVPETDTSLLIHLDNALLVPTSLVIPGQTAVMRPVWFEPGSNATYSGARPAGNLTARVRSFTHEAPAGGRADYAWPSLAPGTYLYESGTHPQVQVQMGLYGALVQNDVDATATARARAYAGIDYDRSVTVLYSEIDPALHQAVASGAYGTAPGPTSTFDYHPRYFLVNGVPYSAGAAPIATVAGGSRILLRFVNAGLRTHVPLLLGHHMEIVAEDGRAYPWPGHPRQQVTVFLPAAKTADAIVTPVNPGPGDLRLALVDRRLDVTNAGTPDGGLIAFLAVTAGPAAPVITSTPGTLGAVGAPYQYQASATDPNPGDTLTWSLDAAPAGAAISASGLVQWTPAAGQAGPNGFTVRVTDAGGLFATQSFVVTVGAGNLAPAITSTPVTTATQGAAYSYPVVATDPNPGDTLAYSLTTAPAGMTISSAGLVQWTPTNAQAITNGGANPVTVRVTDAGGLFATQSFTVVVANVNDPPVAAADGPFTWVEGGTLTVAAPGVLANDGDPDGDALQAVAFAATTGTLTGNPNGSFSWALPMGSGGTRTFTYRARDTSLATSAAATVTVVVQANRPPTAVNDTFTSPRRTRTSPAGTFPRILAVLANDSDPDTAIDPTNVINPATVTIVARPNQGGTATVNSNGTVSYTPALNFRGTDTFTYRVRDNRGTGALSNVATVRVSVQ